MKVEESVLLTTYTYDNVGNRVKEETGKFDNMLDFIENGIIDGTPFLESWENWILEYLF